MNQIPSKLTDQNAPTEAALPSTGPETQASVTGKQLTRRRFTRAGLAAPVILTLANRPAFGAICTVSGFASASPNNPSGVRHKVSGCGGFSPGAWKTPDGGNGDGSRQQWIIAGYYPNPRQGGNTSPGNGNGNGNGNYSDPPGTSFDNVFGTNTGLTLHDVLLQDSGTLEFHTVAALLFAGYFKNIGEKYGLTTEDVIGLYLLETRGFDYKTASGTVIKSGEIDVKAFFVQTYH